MINVFLPLSLSTLSLSRARAHARNTPAYDRLHVIEIHDPGVSGSDRRTDISANTRLLAPIVPLYTTEIPSKMQEDTGQGGEEFVIQRAALRPRWEEFRGTF